MAQTEDLLIVRECFTLGEKDSILLKFKLDITLELEPKVVDAWLCHTFCFFSLPGMKGELFFSYLYDHNSSSSSGAHFLFFSLSSSLQSCLPAGKGSTIQCTGFIT